LIPLRPFRKSRGAPGTRELQHPPVTLLLAHVWIPKANCGHRK